MLFGVVGVHPAERVVPPLVRLLGDLQLTADPTVCGLRCQDGDQGRGRGGEPSRSFCGPQVPGLGAHRQRRGVRRRSPGGGRCAIEVELDPLGIANKHSSAYHSQTYGKVRKDRVDGSIGYQVDVQLGFRFALFARA